MILAVLIIALVVGFLLLAVVSGSKPKPKYRSRQPRAPFSVTIVRQRWGTIQNMTTQGGNGLRQAILEADKLLDYVLQGKGYAGETMAERIRSASSDLSRRNAVSAAHRLRNALAHEVGFDLVASQVKEALADYERAIHDLGGGL